METFLKDVAQKLLNEHPNDLREITVVFNNHRSGLFLKKQFANLVSGSCFLPNIIGIDDLVSKLGKQRIVPNEFLLFELFDIHRNIEGEDRKFETFEEFISFGEMMLADFSEIDLYCVDAEQLFSNLHELKALGEWDLSGQALTPFQQKYLNFYKSLFKYYSELRNRLSENHTAYSGMAYRHVAENIDSMIDSEQQRDIYFVGFNALSECEERIIKAYTRRGIGHMITDGDAYYYDDDAQEAGLFLRKHHKNFPEIGDFEEHFAKGKKKFTIVSCPENVLQTKYAAKILKDNKKPINDTAIVLADESLLMPMLNSLPQEVQTANITMGFPYTGSEAHTLVLKLFSLYERLRDGKYYRQDILDILSDYYIAKLVHAPNMRSRLSDQLTRNKVVRADYEYLKDLGNTLRFDLSTIEFLFTPEKPTADRFLEIAKRLVMALYEAEVAASNTKEEEALACLLQIINHFDELQKKYHFVESLSTLQKIYSRLAQRRSIAFIGKALSGLQILGVLETRNLDFSRVVMLSVNEGMLPSGRSNNTLIPLQLKVNFGIPTYNDKDAVYAYHFFRFIQRAEEVCLIYNGESDGMGKGEPSRFILQICEELKRRYPDNIQIEEIALSAQNDVADDAPLAVGKKTPSVMDRLKVMAENGFSPSALNSYRSCPLKFYYENVLRVRELDEMNDEMDQSDLGSCIHKVLERIYGKYQNQIIPLEGLEQDLKNLPKLLTEEFDNLFLNGTTDEGKNLLLQSVAQTQIENFLKKEIAAIKAGNEITIHNVELLLDRSIGDVKIHGIADRIDKVNNHDRIIDYKSGHVADSDLKVKRNGDIPDKLFQLMTYCWLYENHEGHHLPIQSGIVPLRMIRSDFMPAEWDGHNEISTADIVKFEETLKDLVGEIMNPEIDFSANKKCGLCDFCPMKNVCR